MAAQRLDATSSADIPKTVTRLVNLPCQRNSVVKFMGLMWIKRFNSRIWWKHVDRGNLFNRSRYYASWKKELINLQTKVKMAWPVVLQCSSLPPRGATDAIDVDFLSARVLQTQLFRFSRSSVSGHGFCGFKFSTFPCSSEEATTSQNYSKSTYE